MQVEILNQIDKTLKVFCATRNKEEKQIIALEVESIMKQNNDNDIPGIVFSILDDEISKNS